MSPFLKSKINLYYFICMAALLFIHNYGYSPFVINPSTGSGGLKTISIFIELLFSNSLLRFRMGLLMAVSGYLMANSKLIPYKELLIKKTKTLLIPYVIISSVGLIITFIFENSTFGWHNLNTTGMIGISMWHFTLKDFALYLFVKPVSFQLWYLKTIFLMAVLSPAIRYLLIKIPGPAFAITFVIWMFTNYLDGETRDRCFIFYGLGYYLRLYNKDVLTPIKRLNSYWALAAFVAISIFRATLATFTFPFFGNTTYLLTITFKINEIIGLYAIWFCFQDTVKKILVSPFYIKYCNCSFFIYAFHAPFINYVSQIFRWRGWYEITGMHLLLYILLPAFVLPLMMVLDKAVKKYFPGFFMLMSGGRGEFKKKEEQTVQGAI